MISHQTGRTTVQPVEPTLTWASRRGMS